MGARKYARKHTLADALTPEQLQALKDNAEETGRKVARGFKAGLGEHELVEARKQLVTVVAVQVGKYPGDRLQITRGGGAKGLLWEGKPPKWLRALVAGREMLTFRAQVNDEEVRLCQHL